MLEMLSFEKFRSCLNCSTVSTTADLDSPGVFQDIPELSNLTSQRGLKFLHLNDCVLSTSQSLQASTDVTTLQGH